MSDIAWLSQLKELVNQIGGFQPLAIGLAAFLGGLLSHRIRSRREHDFSVERERLANEFKATRADDLQLLQAQHKQLQSWVDGIIATTTSTYRESIARRIVAIEVMWNAIQEMTEAISSIVYFENILTSAEYENALQHSKLGKVFKTIDIASALEALKNAVKQVQNQRPFLGQSLWNQYSLYQMVAGRIAVQFQMGREKEKLVPPQSDQYLKRLVEAALSDKERRVFDKLKMGRFQWLLFLLQDNIAQEVECIIGGRAAAEHLLRDRSNLTEQLRILDLSEDTMDSGHRRNSSSIEARHLSK